MSNTVAKYQKYADYKDSGVKELGSIPMDWNVSRVKYLTKCLDGQRIPLNAVERGDKKGDIPYWGANKIVDFINDWLFDEELILLGEDGAPFFDRLKDVAFAVNGKIWPNNHVHVLRPLKKVVHTKFLTYALNCTDYSLYISGSTRDKLNQSDMDNIFIRLPTVSEQNTIANFLDHETAQIYNLIAKQEKLIELLKEKRQAVISHAVTKGLNPDVAMKDSGVEWLGQVPEHWGVITLKYLVTAPIIDGPHVSPVKYDEGVPFISAEAVSSGKIDFDKKWGFISKADHKLFSKRYVPKYGDLLIVKLGATTGSVAMVETNEEFNIWVPLATVRVSQKRLNSKFMYYLFQSLQIKDAIQQSWTFGTQQTLGLGTISNFRIPVPTLEESNQIVEYLDEKLNRYEDIIKQAEVSLNLLKERRTALISSAVTGKIDVRNWQHTNEAKTELSP